MKSEVFCYNFIFALTIIGLFVLNWDKSNAFNNAFLVIAVRIISLIFVCIAFLLVAINKIHFTYRDFLRSSVALILAVFIPLYTGRSVFESIFLIVFIIIAYYVSKSPLKLNKSLLLFLIIITFISFVIQLSVYRSENRIVLSIGESNYTGFAIFFLFLLCQMANCKKLGLIAIFLGILTLSRNFVLSVLLFYIFDQVEILKRFVIRIGIINVLFVSHILLFFLSLYFVSNFKSQDKNEERNLHSYTTYEDKSNYYRFLANILFVNEIVQHPQENLLGRDRDEYVKNVFVNIPHNSIFQIILYYGLLLGGIYIFLLLYFFKISVNSDNVPIIMGLLFYFLFLGGGLSGMYIILLAYVLALSRQRPESLKIKKVEL